MSNYKTLGIEKEIESEFNNWNDSDLKKLIDSEYFYLPYVSKREPSEYCEIMVVDCQNEKWWYNKLIGLKFFCKIIYLEINNNKIIKEFKGVKLSNSKQIFFRCFDPKDVIIL